jgi:hypothetical protein
MTLLEQVFERDLPELLRSARSSGVAGTIAFAATSGPETGSWLVSLAECAVRRLEEADRPDLLVEASAQVLALLFSGGLDLGRAVRDGVVQLRGQRELLERLASQLRP